MHLLILFIKCNFMHARYGLSHFVHTFAFKNLKFAAILSKACKSKIAILSNVAWNR